jgi:hypothetical protein
VSISTAQILSLLCLFVGLAKVEITTEMLGYLSEVPSGSHVKLVTHRFHGG